jgi:hypothetical protein
MNSGSVLEQWKSEERRSTGRDLYHHIINNNGTGINSNSSSNNSNDSSNNSGNNKTHHSNQGAIHTTSSSMEFPWCGIVLSTTRSAVSPHAQQPSQVNQKYAKMAHQDGDAIVK